MRVSPDGWSYFLLLLQNIIFISSYPLMSVLCFSFMYDLVTAIESLKAEVMKIKMSRISEASEQLLMEWKNYKNMQSSTFEKYIPEEKIHFVSSSSQVNEFNHCRNQHY